MKIHGVLVALVASSAFAADQTTALTDAKQNTPSVGKRSDRIKDPTLKVGSADRQVPHWSRDRLSRHQGRRFWAIFEAPNGFVPVEEIKNKANVVVRNRVFDGENIALEIEVNGGVGSAVKALRTFSEFLALEPYRSEDKIHYPVRSRGINAGNVQKNDENAWWEVGFSPSKSSKEVQEWCLSNQLDSCQTGTHPSLAKFYSDENVIKNLAKLPEVDFVRPFQQRAPLNLEARTLTGVEPLHRSVMNLTALPASVTSVPANWNTGKDYTGEGVYVNVSGWDGMAPSCVHPDFQEDGINRYVPNHHPGGGGACSDYRHAYHVAGIMAGNGRNSERFGGSPFQWRGVAPKAKLGFNSGWFLDVNNESSIGYDNKSNDFGAYWSRYYREEDLAISQHTNTGHWLGANSIVVQAAGNNGGHNFHGNQKGYFSLTTANLNKIVVGMVNKNTGRKDPNSSMGPTRDGRIGVDVMAPGTNIRSTSSTDGEYVEIGGTSMAAPHVTGIIALMLQKYGKITGRNIHDNPFWNSTARAILIHTATDMVSTPDELNGIGLPDNPDFAASRTNPNEPATEVYGVGPDWATGYGLVNAEKALSFVDSTRYVEARQRAPVGTSPLYTQYRFTVPVGTPRVRVTLVWDDPGQTVVNDLSTNTFPSPLTSRFNIWMVSPRDPATGKTTNHSPWNLDPTPIIDAGNPHPSETGIDPKVTRAAILQNPAKKDGINTRNNVRVIDVDNPRPGVWTIVVGGTPGNINSAGQDYSLVSDFPFIK